MTDWKDKRVIVIGTARQGLALGRFLAGRGAWVVMNDQKSPEQLAAARQSMADLAGSDASRIKWVLGSHPISLLENANAVCVSGGVPLTIPLIQEALQRGILLTNDSQIFLEECPCKTIGITGSAGKTTTTSLVGKIAECDIDTSAGRSQYHKVWVGGNIGSPLLAVVDEIKADDLAVLELSSFQLELMTNSAKIACILNITPNHFDRHASMEAYVAAKKRILDYQGQTDTAILGSDDPVTWRLAKQVHGRIASFGRSIQAEGIPGAYIDGDWLCLWNGREGSRLIRQSEIPLRGWHNVENVLAAIAISQSAGLSVEAMQSAIRSFSGVAHRLEWVASWKGADWFNDSIATAPERVIAAIHAFDTPEDIQRPIVLLAGGRDKNLPWYELAKLIHTRVEHLVLFGEATSKISEAVGSFSKGNRPQSIEKCSGLEQAVNTAARLVKPGDIVLLSPGGTSFDEFQDFEERGEAFKRWVHNLSCK